MKPHFKSDIHISGNQLKSIAQLNGKLYVICKKSNTVQVINYLTDHDKLETFTVVGMTSPSDIISYDDRNCLFISDPSQRCIWKINATENKSVKFTETSFAPYTISLKSRRMVVVPHTGDTLHLYNENGKAEQRCRCPLPGYMWAHHAVEKDRQTFIVCHTARLLTNLQPTDSSTELTELSANGSVLRIYNGPKRCNAPRYMAVGLENHIPVSATDVTTRFCYLHKSYN